MSPGRGGELERIHVERNIYVAMVWTVFWDAYHTKHRCRRRHWRKMTDGFCQLWETYRTQNQAGSRWRLGANGLEGKTRCLLMLERGCRLMLRFRKSGKSEVSRDNAGVFPDRKVRNRKSSVSSSLGRFGAWEYHHSIRVKNLDRLCENKFWKKIVMKILKQTTSMKNVYENFHENIVDEKFSKKKIIKKKTEDFFCNFLKY